MCNKKWYDIDAQNTDHGEENENSTNIKLKTKVIISSLWDYADAYVPVTGDTAKTNGDTDTNVAFKNCAPFTKCVTHIDNEQYDTARNLAITMTMYNLIKYIDNYLDTSGR